MIRLSEIQKAFMLSEAQTIIALDGISIDFAAGEWVTIIGSNGSGKSTLLNIISGSVFPTSGKILVEGRDVTDVPEWRRAGMIARVFQNPSLGTADQLTLAENLALSEKRGRRFSPFKFCVHQDRLGRYRELLAGLGMGLEDRLDDPMSNLSGGQRQAVCVLMASLARPKVLLFDEHLAALDPRSSAAVMQATKELVFHHQPTTLMVTHNIEDSLRFGDRLVMLHRGRALLDIRGSEKTSMSVEQVVQLFHESAGADETPKAFLNR